MRKISLDKFLIFLQTHCLFIVILLSAILIRISVINRSLVYDEAFSAYTYFQSDLKNILTGEYFANNHIFYSISANLSYRLLGSSEWVFRLPALIFGLFSIFLIYLIGRKLLSAPIAVISSILISFSLLHVRFSTEARGYSTLILLALATFYLIISALKTGKIQYWIALVLSLIIANGFHLYNVMTYPGLVIIFLYYFSLDLKRNKYSISINLVKQTFLFLGSVSASLLITVLVYHPQIDLVNYFLSKITSGRYPGLFFKTVQPFLLDLNYLKSLFVFLFFGPGNYLNYAALFFLFMGSIYLWRDKRLFVYLLTFIISPLLFAWLFSLTYYYRFFIFLLPFLILFVASGIFYTITRAEILLKIHDNKYSVVAFALFLGFILAPKQALEPENLYYHNKVEKESEYYDTKSLTDYMRENIKENDIILSCTPFAINGDYQMILKYYLGDLYDKHQLKQLSTRENGRIDVWLLSNTKVSSAADIKRVLLIPAGVRFNLIQTFSGWYVYKSPFFINRRSRSDALSRLNSFRHFLQAFYDQRNKKFDEATENYNLFLKTESQQEFAYNNLAVIAAENGRDKQALEFLEKATDKNSNLTAAWINLGLIYHKMGVIKSDEDLLQKSRDIVLGKLDDLESKSVKKDILAIVKSNKFRLTYPWQVATLDWHVPPGEQKAK